LTLDQIKSLIARIRWQSVLALLLFVVVIVVLFKSLPGGYQIGGGLGLKVTANPWKIVPGDSTTLDVELKNINKDRNVSVIVKAQTYDKNLFFEESYAQSYGTASISLGPQEMRKLKFKVKSKPDIIEGKYTIDFSATPTGEGKGVENRVSLEIEKKQD